MSKTNLKKTRNSSIIYTELQINNVKTFAFFENFFQGHLASLSWKISAL